MAEELDGSDLVDLWMQQNKPHHLEGDSGLEKLEKLCEVLGYRNTGFRFGTPIEHFLSDNPGACEALVEFMAEWADRNPEWKERLEGAVEVEPEACESCGDDLEEDESDLCGDCREGEEA